VKEEKGASPAAKTKTRKKKEEPAPFPCISPARTSPHHTTHAQVPIHMHTHNNTDLDDENPTTAPKGCALTPLGVSPLPAPRLFL
jgi:hypothetical protein